MAWPTDFWLLATIFLTGAWYCLGSRLAYVRALPSGRRRRPDSLWRALAFYGALATILVALGSLDRLADRLFVAHMLQHLLLMLLAAPLLVLAAPWNALWRPFPLRFRRALAGTVVRSPALRPLRRFAGLLALAWPAWLLFNGDIALWHLPVMYDLTLRNTPVHYVEHLSFIAFGILFWAQTIDSPPLRSRLGYFGRAVFAGAGAAATWVLAVVLALAPSALYGGYANLASRPAGLSALSDQQLAAGVMWGPGSITYAVVIIWALYRWLDDEEASVRRRRRRQPHSVRQSPA
jgi:cytochrome c oxidase assembly factor CtaG